MTNYAETISPIGLAKAIRGSITVLPSHLRKHMKMRQTNGVFIRPDAPVVESYDPTYLSKDQQSLVIDGREYTTLTVCNDGKNADSFGGELQRLSFAQIADIIEQHGDRIFYT